MTVAATTPTYAWIPFVGWIAGGSVAAVYGAKALTEKEAIGADAQRITAIHL